AAAFLLTVNDTVDAPRRHALLETLELFEGREYGPRLPAVPGGGRQPQESATAADDGVEPEECLDPSTRGVVDKDWIFAGLELEARRGCGGQGSLECSGNRRRTVKRAQIPGQRE